MYINCFKLPKDIQIVLKDFLFYRIDSKEGIVIQNTKILKTCLIVDISQATSRTNPSKNINHEMNIHNSHTSEYWEFSGNVFIKPSYLRYSQIYLSAVNCNVCGNYRYTQEIYSRIMCCCKGDNLEDDEDYRDYIHEIYYDF
jgi:hypothetical protein